MESTSTITNDLVYRADGGGSSTPISDQSKTLAPILTIEAKQAFHGFTDDEMQYFYLLAILEEIGEKHFSGSIYAIDWDNIHTIIGQILDKTVPPLSYNRYSSHVCSWWTLPKNKRVSRELYELVNKKYPIESHLDLIKEAFIFYEIEANHWVKLETSSRPAKVIHSLSATANALITEVSFCESDLLEGFDLPEISGFIDCLESSDDLISTPLFPTEDESEDFSLPPGMPPIDKKNASLNNQWVLAAVRAIFSIAEEQNKDRSKKLIDWKEMISCVEKLLAISDLPPSNDSFRSTWKDASNSLPPEKSRIVRGMLIKKLSEKPDFLSHVLYSRSELQKKWLTTAGRWHENINPDELLYSQIIVLIKKIAKMNASFFINWETIHIVVGEILNKPLTKFSAEAYKNHLTTAYLPDKEKCDQLSALIHAKYPKERLHELKSAVFISRTDLAKRTREAAGAEPTEKDDSHNPPSLKHAKKNEDDE